MATPTSTNDLELPAASRVIGSDGIVATSTGLRVDIRLPWYRSLPLSTVEVGEVRISGNIIDPAKVVFELEGKRFALGELADQVSAVWYVLDSAYLDITAGPWKVGDELELSVSLILYPPYIPGLKRMTVQAKNLRLHSNAPTGDNR
ncbi:MAG TPA: DUF6379 domain-containing protein [Candidatus Binataceae bacterium]|nr:DUF6379 domain-containing protein [Candidatus Binataceae bacterium]